MTIDYRKAEGVIAINGTAIGGVLNGTGPECNDLHCVIATPKCVFHRRHDCHAAWRCNIDALWR